MQIKELFGGGGAVQTLRIFSLVSRNLCVYVCVVTSNFNLFQTVLNATYRVDRLLKTGMWWYWALKRVRRNEYYST